MSAAKSGAREKTGTRVVSAAWRCVQDEVMERLLPADHRPGVEAVPRR
jgi:hypothetical protein